MWKISSVCLRMATTDTVCTLRNYSADISLMPYVPITIAHLFTPRMASSVCVFISLSLSLSLPPYLSLPLPTSPHLSPPLHSLLFSRLSLCAHADILDPTAGKEEKKSNLVFTLEWTANTGMHSVSRGVTYTHTYRHTHTHLYTHTHTHTLYGTK